MMSTAATSCATRYRCPWRTATGFLTVTTTSGGVPPNTAQSPAVAIAHAEPASAWHPTQSPNLSYIWSY